MNDERYIIEHTTRGAVMDQEYDDLPETRRTLNVHLNWRTRFSWSGPRSDSHVYFSLDEVKMALSRIDPRLRRDCKVRRYGSWSIVYPSSEAGRT